MRKVSGWFSGAGLLRRRVAAVVVGLGLLTGAAACGQAPPGQGHGHSGETTTASSGEKPSTCSASLRRKLSGMSMGKYAFE